MVNLLRDGQVNCLAGTSTAVDPEYLPENAVAWAKNVSIRGGKPRTRMALVERAVLPRGNMQGIGYFSAHRGMLVAHIDGRLHRITADGTSFKTQSIPSGFMNSRRLNTAWMCEADGSLVIQDGQSAAIIYDGSRARRADRRKFEVPIGRMMAYGNGRLWVVINENEIAAGDIKTGEFQSELLFTEIGYLLGGGAFYVPRKLTGIAFMPVSDTATGYGSLMAFTRNSTTSFRAEVSSRDLWQQVPGFQTVVFPSIGSSSHHSLVEINQDLYFRSGTGDMRSLRSARAEIEGPGNAPISREISRLVDFESNDLLDQASGIYFDGYLLSTASPFIGPKGQTLFRAITPLDFSPISTMQGRSAPAYAGQWDGLWFRRLVKGMFDGVERAFAVSTDAIGRNRLWEFVPSERQDRSLSAPSPVRAYVEYRKFAFQSSGVKKRLERCDIYLAELEGEGTVEVYYRADNHPQWTKWDEFTFCAKTTEAEATGPHVWRNLSRQFRSQVKTLTAPDGVSTITGYALHVGFNFQIRVVWTGSAQIDRVGLFASAVDETPYADRGDLLAECRLLDSGGNEVSYEIPATTDPALTDTYANQDGDTYADQNAENYTNV